MVTIICPECEKDDMIHKVSAVYSGGFSTVQNNSPLVAYGAEPSTVTAITPLAKKLAPPVQPKEPGQTGCGTVIIGSILGIVAGFFCQLIFRSETYGTIVAVGIFIGAIMLSQRDILKKQKEYKALMPIWKQRKAKWDELYYCTRNDCVFYPNKGKAVSPDRMNELIYQ
jgi:hypothetical protein